MSWVCQWGEYGWCVCQTHQSRTNNPIKIICFTIMTTNQQPLGWFENVIPPKRKCHFARWITCAIFSDESVNDLLHLSLEMALFSKWVNESIDPTLNANQAMKKCSPTEHGRMVKLSDWTRMTKMNKQREKRKKNKWHWNRIYRRRVWIHIEMNEMNFMLPTRYWLNYNIEFSDPNAD